MCVCVCVREERVQVCVCVCVYVRVRDIARGHVNFMYCYFSRLTAAFFRCYNAPPESAYRHTDRHTGVCARACVCVCVCVRSP